MHLGSTTAWRAGRSRKSGGRTPGQGHRAGRQHAVLREGNSFLVSASHTFTVPSDPNELGFTYSDLFFDTTDRIRSTTPSRPPCLMIRGGVWSTRLPPAATPSSTSRRSSRSPWPRESLITLARSPRQWSHACRGGRGAA